MRFLIVMSIALLLLTNSAWAAHIADLSVSVECSVGVWDAIAWDEQGYPTEYELVYSKTTTKPTGLTFGLSRNGCQLNAVPYALFPSMADPVYEVTDSYVLALAWADVYPFYWDDRYLEGRASASISYGAIFYTPGPVRPGILSIDVDSLNRGWGTLAVRSSVSGAMDLTECNSGSPCSLPFDLGSPFRIDLSASADSNGGQSLYMAEVYLSAFEADGITPVALSSVPEPGPASLVLAGLLVLGGACWRWRARNHRTRPELPSA